MEGKYYETTNPMHCILHVTNTSLLYRITKTLCFCREHLQRKYFRKPGIKSRISDNEGNI